MGNEQIDEQGTTAEIECYMAIPAQALSYKTGAMKIRELRNKYRQQLGTKFSIAAFLYYSNINKEKFFVMRFYSSILNFFKISENKLYLPIITPLLFITT